MFSAKLKAAERCYCATGLWVMLVMGFWGLERAWGSGGSYQEIFWNNPLGEWYTEATNWDPPVVPGPEDIAVFDLGMADPYRVYLESYESWTSAGLEVRGDQVWLILNQGRLELLGAWGGYSLVVGAGGGKWGRLLVSDGVLEGLHAEVGRGVGEMGLWNLISGAQVNLGGRLTVGGSGTGLCAILGASHLEVQMTSVGRGGGGDGELWIGFESQVINRNHVWIGEEEGSMGKATVSGMGSYWLMRDGTEWGALFIGQAGEGYLEVEYQGFLETGQGFVGVEPSGQGVVRTRREGHFRVDGYFVLGGRGYGGLEVSEGGWADVGYCTMAEQAGSVAEAVVSGVGSVWEMWNWAVGDNLVIGQGGTAQVIVKDGGRLITQRDIVVGSENGSSGRLEVGSGGGMAPIWNGGDDEKQETWGVVPINGGGAGEEVICAGLTIGEEAGSWGQVKVSGESWESLAVMRIGRDYMGGQAIVGQFGSGRLHIGPYGQVLLPEIAIDPGNASIRSSVWMTIGREAGSSGEVVVEGPQALLEIEHAPLIVGDWSSEAYLMIRDGGILRMGDGELWVGSCAGSVGAVSVWDGGRIEEHSAYASVIGARGTGFLTLWDSRTEPEDTTEARFSHLTIGEEEEAWGYVRVSNGVLTVAGTLTVGDRGAGELKVADGLDQPNGPGIVKVGEFEPGTVFMPGSVTVGPEGFLQGTGLIRGRVVCLGMFVRPGASELGVLKIEGQYVQEWPGNLLITIGGTEAGVSYSQLEVFGPGDVMINGGALVLAFDDYLPQAGDVFDIIRFSGILTPEANWFDVIWIWGLGPIWSGQGIWEYHLELIGNGTGEGILRVVSDNTVPEAASGLLAAGLLAGMGMARRRRN